MVLWLNVSAGSTGTLFAFRLLVVRLLLGFPPLHQVLYGNQHCVDGLLQLLGELRGERLREVCKQTNKIMRGYHSQDAFDGS